MKNHHKLNITKIEEKEHETHTLLSIGSIKTIFISSTLYTLLFYACYVAHYNLTFSVINAQSPKILLCQFFILLGLSSCILGYAAILTFFQVATYKSVELYTLTSSFRSASKDWNFIPNRIAYRYYYLRCLMFLVLILPLLLIHDSSDRALWSLIFYWTLSIASIFYLVRSSNGKTLKTSKLVSMFSDNFIFDSLTLLLTIIPIGVLRYFYYSDRRSVIALFLFPIITNNLAYTFVKGVNATPSKNIILRLFDLARANFAKAFVFFILISTFALFISLPPYIPYGLALRITGDGGGKTLTLLLKKQGCNILESLGVRIRRVSKEQCFADNISSIESFSDHILAKINDSAISNTVINIPQEWILTKVSFSDNTERIWAKTRLENYVSNLVNMQDIKYFRLLIRNNGSGSERFLSHPNRDSLISEVLSSGAYSAHLNVTWLIPSIIAYNNQYNGYNKNRKPHKLKINHKIYKIFLKPHSYPLLNPLKILKAIEPRITWTSQKKSKESSGSTARKKDNMEINGSASYSTAVDMFNQFLNETPNGNLNLYSIRQIKTRNFKSIHYVTLGSSSKQIQVYYISTDYNSHSYLLARIMPMNYTVLLNLKGHYYTDLDRKTLGRQIIKNLFLS